MDKNTGIGRRQFVKQGALLAGGFAAAPAILSGRSGGSSRSGGDRGSAAAEAGERLYNGIRLPREWPPRDLAFSTDGKVMPVPYLESVPDVIGIDVGRQLFVDDFLIERTDLDRSFHQPRVDGPVLLPETDLEMNDGICPCACPFNDGIFYDPKEKLFKMWYHAGWFDGTALAVSTDGRNWERPELGVVKGTNRVLPDDYPVKGARRDGVGVWLDHDAEDPDERFKMFAFFRTPGHRDEHGGRLLTSPDGRQWRERARTGPCGDNTTFFYNPFRKKWVFSIRDHFRNGWLGSVRIRSYYEHPSFLDAAGWEADDPVFWGQTDELDPIDRVRRAPTQLYNVDAVGYESLMLGLHMVWYGPPNPICQRLREPKKVELATAFSRDGFHWHRPERRPFIESSGRVGDWNRAYLHSAGGCCLVVGDELYFYFGAFSGESPRLPDIPDEDRPYHWFNEMYAGGGTGLAILRRDGFASMDAGGDGGYLATRPVSFDGRRLFVNVDCPEGELRVEIQDRNGRVIEPFGLSNCVPVAADSTAAQITWGNGGDLSRLRGEPVRFRFHLKSGKLYAFWVSPDGSGASRGYVAAGGPGFEGSKDTLGI